MGDVFGSDWHLFGSGDDLMWPRSPGFADAVRHGGEIITRADVLSGGKLAATGIAVGSVQITADRTQTVRRTVQLTVDDPTLEPKTLMDLLQPLGNEIRLWRGFRLPGGDELVPVGTFGIRDAEFPEPGGPVSVTGKDRAQRVVEARFTVPRTAYGPSARALLRELITEAVPFATVQFAPTFVDRPVPLVTWQQDRNTACDDLCAAMGAEWFADPLGTFVVQPVPALTGAPVVTVDSGGIMVTGSRKVTRDGVYNGVIASGQPSGAGAAVTSGLKPNTATDPLIADYDPTSPTYWYGNFGQAPAFYTSPLLQTVEQCKAAAEAILRNYAGLPKSVALTSLPDPCINEGDLIRVVYADGTSEVHILDSIQPPFTADQVLSASTRSSTSYTMAQPVT